MSGFQRFVIADIDDKYAPPEKPVLDATVIDGKLFLRIGTLVGDSGEIKEVAQTAVHLDEFLDHLGAAYRSDLRAQLRASPTQSSEGGK